MQGYKSHSDVEPMRSTVYGAGSATKSVHGGPDRADRGRRRGLAGNDLQLDVTRDFFYSCHDLFLQNQPSAPGF